MNDLELLETIKQLKKEKKRWYDKIYRFENRDKKKENKKKYYQKNKEKIKENTKKYKKTPAGYKSHKIAQWKRYGVIHNDFEKLFELYVNTTNCENCKVILTIDRNNTSTTKCLDHCHLTGKFRNILCIACNVRRK